MINEYHDYIHIYVSCNFPGLWAMGKLAFCFLESGSLILIQALTQEHMINWTELE